MLQLHYPDARRPLIERDRSPARPVVNWVSTFHCFIFPAVAAYLLGYDLGAVPGAITSLQDDPQWKLGTREELLVQHGALLGAIGTSLLLLLAGNRMGRVLELTYAAVCHLLGALGAFSATSVWQLVCWRLVGGAGMGLSLHAGTIYIAETCAAHLRGALICLKEACLVVGMLVGYWVSHALEHKQGGWRGTFLAATPGALLLLSGAMHLPESPRWILLHTWQPDVMQVWLSAGGQVAIPQTPGYAAARAALIRARGRNAVGQQLEKELSGIAVSVREALLAGASPFRLLSQKLYYRPLLAGLCLMLLQQVTGQAADMYFATNILRDAGYTRSPEELVGGLRLLMTLVAAANVDVWGRRPLLLFGASGMTLSVVVLAMLQLPDSTTPSPASSMAPAVVSIVALLLLVCCYQVSLGPLVWVTLAEMFPLAVRGPALAAANCAGLTSSLLVATALPRISQMLGGMWTYCAFGALCLLSLWAVWALVPELKGKSLEEVEVTWGGSLPLATVPSNSCAAGHGQGQPSPCGHLPSVSERNEEGDSSSHHSSSPYNNIPGAASPPQRTASGGESSQTALQQVVL